MRRRPPRAPALRRSLAGSTLWALCVLGAAAGQEPPDRPAETAPPRPPLTLEVVHVGPERPAPDTLCRLSVTLRNGGERIASQLGFTVTIDGQALPVYRNQLFMFPVAAGEAAELRLYNFWSTETSRPPPADGRLTVEVRLVEAQWMDIRDEDGVEVWTPLGAVTGLPVAASVTLEMSKAP